MRRSGRTFIWGFAAIYAVAILAVPQLLTDFHVELLTTYATFAFVAVSLDLLWGYTGILNIGHFAFFGIGAYTVALLTVHIPSESVAVLALWLIAATLVPAAIGLALAGFCFMLKLRDLFVLVTIAFAIVAEKVATAQVDLLGGINGIILPYWVVPADLTTYYQIVVTVGAVAYLATRLVVRSPFGQVLRAIRDSEDRAMSLGYDTRGTKAIVFAIAAGVAGLGGGLYAILTGFVSPQLLGFAPSFDAVVWMMIGGLGTLYGPIVGVLSVNAVKFYLSSVLLDYWPIAIGALFVLTVLFFPRGIAGIFQQFVRGSPAEAGPRRLSVNQ